MRFTPRFLIHIKKKKTKSTSWTFFVNLNKHKILHLLLATSKVEYPGQVEYTLGMLNTRQCYSMRSSKINPPVKIVFQANKAGYFSTQVSLEFFSSCLEFPLVAMTSSQRFFMNGKLFTTPGSRVCFSLLRHSMWHILCFYFLLP